MNIKRLKKLLTNCFMPLCFGLAIAIIMNLFFMRTNVPTGSMLPTIQLNDTLLVQRIYNTHSLTRGDIIVFQPNTEEGSNLYIKRLIGLPGDTIEFKLIDGKSTVWVNGELLDEPYVLHSSNEEITKTFIVPDNCYFFLGDNRENSIDSRYWNNSYIHESQIKGKMIFNLTQFFKQLLPPY